MIPVRKQIWSNAPHDVAKAVIHEVETAVSDKIERCLNDVHGIWWAVPRQIKIQVQQHLNEFTQNRNS